MEKKVYKLNAQLRLHKIAGDRDLIHEYCGMRVGTSRVLAAPHCRLLILRPHQLVVRKKNGKTTRVFRIEDVITAEPYANDIKRGLRSLVLTVRFPGRNKPLKILCDVYSTDKVQEWTSLIRDAVQKANGDVLLNEDEESLHSPAKGRKRRNSDPLTPKPTRLRQSRKLMNLSSSEEEDDDEQDEDLISFEKPEFEQQEKEEKKGEELIDFSATRSKRERSASAVASSPIVKQLRPAPTAALPAGAISLSGSRGRTRSFGERADSSLVPDLNSNEREIHYFDIMIGSNIKLLKSYGLVTATATISYKDLLPAGTQPTDKDLSNIVHVGKAKVAELLKQQTRKISQANAVLAVNYNESFHHVGLTMLGFGTASKIQIDT